MPEKIAKIEEFNSYYNLENENNFDVSIINIENFWVIGIKKEKRFANNNNGAFITNKLEIVEDDLCAARWDDVWHALFVRWCVRVGLRDLPAGLN